MNIDEVNYIFIRVFSTIFIFSQSEASIPFRSEMTLTFGSKTFKWNSTHFWAFSGILNCIKLIWSCQLWCKIWQQWLWIVWRSYRRDKKLFCMTIFTTLTWRSETSLENLGSILKISLAMFQLQVLQRKLQYPQGNQRKLAEGRHPRRSIKRPF